MNRLPSDIKVSNNPTTLAQQSVILLHRLVGARLQIKRMQKTSNDYSLNLTGAVHVRFINRGQTALMIDDQILLLPGEAYIEGDTAGPGLDHTYKVEFLPQAKNGVPEPSSDIPYVIPGNLLDMRIMYRIY